MLSSFAPTLVASLPSLVIPIGVKSVVSLGGIVTLGLGVWHVDRTWDEKGSQAFAKAQELAKSKGKTNSVTIPQKDLDASFPFPIGFIAGWTLYAGANLFPSISGFSSKLAVTSYGSMAAAASMALSYIASVPMGKAVQTRNAGMKQKLSMAFVSGWAALTYATTKANPDVSPVFCIAGAMSIIASMKILWKNRKMGDSWEQHGTPNPNPIVYNPGGPLFVFGWFLYWIGLCATTTGGEASWNGAGLPLYLDVKTLLSFVCGCGMVPVVMFLDYAHDEGAEFTGFGTDGRYFGRFLESPIPFILAWAGFGASAVVSASGVVTTKALTILANCVAQGVDAGVLIQTALYKGDMETKNKWSIPFVGLFMALAANIGWGGGLKLALALPGAMMIIAGQKTVFGDRKRGDYFMQNNMKENPNPIVYSYGEPLFMTGWILISWGMSLVGRA